MPDPDVAAPLPKGPHGLSREQVARSQRHRMVEAMARAVADKGYLHTTVADVLERAGVSRRTFYELFSDKEDCFMASLDLGADRLQREMQAALDGLEPADGGGALDRFDRLLGRYLEVMACEPALARTFLVEVHAAGPRAQERRWAVQAGFADVVAGVFAGEPGLLGDRPDQRFAVEALIGAVSSKVTALVGTGDYDRIPDLREPVTRFAAALSRCGGGAP